MNIEALQEHRDRLAKLDPKAFWMPTWLAHRDNPTEDFDNYDLMGLERAAGCNTIGCIAGWKVVFDGVANDMTEFMAGDYAREAFDLTFEEANWLFGAKWRSSLRVRHVSRIELAEVTLDEVLHHMDRMIAAGGIPQ